VLGDLASAKSTLLFLGVALLVLLISAGPLGAQVQTAAISGTATDASGAVLVGAQVQATNTTTNASQSATTDAQGRYRIADLAVGVYNVKASHEGFRTVIHKDVTLAVGSSVNLDFSLPVGQAAETVSVEASVSRVETETSELSALIAPVQMRELPLNGRNFEQLIALTPGVATVSSQTNLANFVVGRMYGAQDNYSVAGMRPTGQAFLLDGTDIRDFWEHGTGSGYAGTSLGVEAIGEFQMLTSNYNAQFSGNGVVMNATSRSGSNDWHGGFYEYLRNNHLDASALADRDAVLLANEAGVKAPSSPPPFKRNQFGGAIGGPIKKNKAFFFANYEGLRDQLVTNFAPVYLPMPYVLNGQLPCSLMPVVGLFGQPAFPGCNGGVSNTAATANHWIPGSAQNPLVTVPATANTAQMLNILKMYQLCTTCGPAPAVGSSLDQGGYYTTSESPAVNTNEDYVMGRFDYTLGSKDTAFVRYTIDDARVADGMRDPTGIFPETDITRNQYLTITERRVVSATTVNSLRFGFTRTREESSTPFHLSSAQLAKIGLSSDPLDLVNTAIPGVTPAYSDAAQRLDGSLGASALELGGIAFPELGPDPDRPLNQIQNKFSGGDDLLVVHGAHSLAIGAVVQRVQTNGGQLAYASGQDYIAWTPNNNNFATLESFLQGTPSWGYFVPQGFANGSRYFREIGVAPYIQDNWKVSRRLTLNIGIRYDYFTNPVGWAGGNQSLTAIQASYLAPTGPLAVVPNCSGITVTTDTSALAACKLGIFQPVTHVFSNNPNAQNFEPRFGFAYDVFGDHKTSLRGGFGIFHDPVSARIYSSGFGSEPPSSSFQLNNFTNALVDNGILDIPVTNNPCFPNPFAVVAGTCGQTNPSPGEFAAVDYQVRHGSPYVMQYNLNIQRQLTGGTVLTLGYVGSLGRHLWMQRDENPPMCATFPNCSAVPTVADPNSGACFTVGCGTAAATTTALGKINPNFGARVLEATTASSSYNGFQATLNRQFSKTFSGQVNYTWSKCIDDGSFATSLEQWGQLQSDPYNEQQDYGNCNFDIRHNITANGVYSLPFKGNRLVAGWQASTIISFNTGMPLNIANSLFADPSGLGGQWGTRPNYTFAAGCSPNDIQPKMIFTGQIWTYQWLPPGQAPGTLLCYAPQADGYLGNVARNSVPGPHFFNADFSVMKNTKITEKLSMQFRAEFFNILNHFNPSGVGINTTLGGTGNGPSGAGDLQANNPRQVQFAVKFDF
jgi:hypothetical protein